MASNVTKKYINSILLHLSETINDEKITDLSFDNLKRIIDNSEILNKKIKSKKGSRISGWHIYIRENRKNNSMAECGSQWKSMSDSDKEPYNEKARIEKEQINKDESADENTNTTETTKTKTKTKTNKKTSKKNKPLNVWLFFKKKEHANGNNDMGLIKEKYSNLSEDDKDELKKESLEEFEKTQNNNNSDDLDNDSN